MKRRWLTIGLLMSLLLGGTMPVTHADPSALAEPLAEEALREALQKAYEAGNYARIAWLVTPAAEDGDADAQFELGRLYFSGRGVAQNYNAAVKWLSAAATQGHPGARRYMQIICQRRPDICN